MILVSPAERAPALLALGTVSPLPEKFGVDFMWMGKQGKWGVQRKEVKDLLASVGDGRLARERGMWPKLDHVVLLVEGRLRYDAAGVLMTGGRGGRGYGRVWRHEEVQGLLVGFAKAGVTVIGAEDVAGTARAIVALEKWSRKERHGGVAGREPLASVWGKPTNREFAVYMLSGLPGVGVELAGRIVDKFGVLPWAWTVTREDLLAVEGLGKKKVDTIYAAIGRKADDGWD